MSNRKKLVFLLIPLLLLLILCLGLLLIFNAKQANTEVYTESIKTAGQYLASNDIENAIIYYEKAKNADKTQEEPYLQLAVIYYTNKNDIGTAISILKEGQNQVRNSQKIKNALAVYIQLQNDAGTSVGGDIQQATALVNQNQKFVEHNAVNTVMLEMFAQSNYAGYATKYSVEKEDYTGGIYTVKYAGLDAQFFYYDTDANKNIVDEVSFKPNPQATPCEIKLSNIEVIVPSAKRGVTLDSLKASAPSYNFSKAFDKTINKNVISFICNGCSVCIECDVNGNVQGTDVYNRIVPVQQATSQVTIKLSGKVKVKGSSQTVAGATIQLRQGHDVHEGTIYKEETSSADGSYEVEADVGEYTAEVSAEHYGTKYVNVTIDSTSKEVTLDFELSQKTAGGGIRIILEWADGTQVTSHAHCGKENGSYSSSGQVGHYSYLDNPTLYIGNTLVADYQRESNREIMTFYDTDEDFEYEYHVHGDFENTDVKVTVEIPGQSPVVITNPDSRYVYPNFYWVVFEMNGGNISVHGTQS